MKRIRRKGGAKLRGLNALVLTTIGRKSGQPRSTPVGWFPGRDGGRLIVASAAGATKNPAWCHNLAAHLGNVRVEVGAARRRSPPSNSTARPEGPACAVRQGPLPLSPSARTCIIPYEFPETCLRVVRRRRAHRSDLFTNAAACPSRHVAVWWRRSRRMARRRRVTWAECSRGQVSRNTCQWGNAASRWPWVRRASANIA
ncbi:nitroreductase family deazaflavin-dependent oxidoreductase [Streptomyces sp. NPDC050619]|uniref:nitroreductase family deazaflavin-dependent oxidoreductase n=1 Tax=Streptomyces sp. NPDC050619 TaxID=3157214 RepID=UPI00341F048E